VFPVRYELHLYILFGRNSVFKGLNSPHCMEMTVIVGPANRNGCIILCVGNLADEEF
jgi:hypothetical protein